MKLFSIPDSSSVFVDCPWCSFGSVFRHLLNNGRWPLPGDRAAGLFLHYVPFNAFGSGADWK